MRKSILLFIITAVILIGVPGVNFAQDLGIIANFAVFSTTGAITFTGTNTSTGNTGSNGSTTTTAPSSLVGLNYSTAGPVTSQAAGDLAIAYVYLHGQTGTSSISTPPVGGTTTTYTAGIYDFTDLNVLFPNKYYIILSGAGTFIFRIKGTFAATNGNFSITYTGGAQACNVYWVAESDITFPGNTLTGTFISHSGNILMGTSVVTGRVLSMVGTINLAGGAANIAVDCTGTYWQGSATSSDFSLGTNWKNGPPTTSLKGFIPPTLTIAGAVFPSLSNTSSATTITAVGDLSIQPPGTLTIPLTYKLQVAGKLTSSGTITATSGTVEMNGSVAQTLPQRVFLYDTVKNLIISNSGSKSLTIVGTLPTNITGTLSFGSSNNTLITGGYLTLASTSAATAQVADITTAGTYSGNTITGNVNVQRYIPSRRAWRLITAPITGSNTIYTTWQNSGSTTAGLGLGMYVTGAYTSGNGLDQSNRNNASLKTWTFGPSTSSFTNVTDTKATTSIISNVASTGVVSNIGYFAFVRGDRSATNMNNVSISSITTLSSAGALQTGNLVYNIPNASTTGTAGYFALIGNPYAAPVDLQKIVAGTGLSNISPIFYTWDANQGSVGGYVTFTVNATGTYYSKSPNTSTQTSAIQSGQAFFVTTNTANTAASITFKESFKTTNNTVAPTAGFRPMEPNTPSNSTGSLAVNIYYLNTDSSLKLADGNLTQFNNSFSAALLRNEDAIKLTNINENLGLLRNESLLAIESRPNLSVTDTIFLNLRRATHRAYRFQFEPSNLDNTNLAGYLQDKYLNTSAEISLTNNTPIDFSINGDSASAAADRFQIVFKTLLPFAFTNITAAKVKSNIAVAWEVANETDITGYEVERSTDGTNFTKVDTRLVIGNNNATGSYSWIDENAQSGDHIYRIKMLGKDGSTKYTENVKVTIAAINTGINIYPNPIKEGKINIQMGNQPMGTYQLSITNNNGQVVYTGTIQNNSNNSNFLIKLNTKAAKGIYNLQISTPENKISSQKLIVE